MIINHLERVRQSWCPNTSKQSTWGTGGRHAPQSAPKRDGRERLLSSLCIPGRVRGSNAGAPQEHGGWGAGALLPAPAQGFVSGRDGKSGIKLGRGPATFTAFSIADTPGFPGSTWAGTPCAWYSKGSDAGPCRLFGLLGCPPHNPAASTVTELPSWLQGWPGLSQTPAGGDSAWQGHPSLPVPQRSARNPTPLHPPGLGVNQGGGGILKAPSFTSH